MSREGEEKGEERENRLPCDPESESLQGLSSCGAKTPRRAYHVTPDLRWHGQQLSYSSLYVFTEYSTSVEGILPLKLLETISVSIYIPTYRLRSWWCPHGTTKNTLPRTYIIRTTSLLQYKIMIFRFGTQSRRNNKAITLDFNLYCIVLKLEFIIYFPSTRTRKGALDNQCNCEYLSQTTTSTSTTTYTNYYIWLHIPNRPQRRLQSNVYTRTEIQ